MNLHTLIEKANSHKIAQSIALLFYLLAIWNFANIFMTFGVGKTTDSQAIHAKFETLPNIADMHLFGFHPLALDANNLPETTLDVTLVGVFAASPEKDAKAVIVDEGQQKLVGINDVVSGVATVVRILPRSIILKHNDTYEVLSLPKPDLPVSQPPPSLNLPGALKM